MNVKSFKLGSYRKGNDSRDFFKNIKLPLDCNVGRKKRILPTEFFFFCFPKKIYCGRHCQIDVWWFFFCDAYWDVHISTMRLFEAHDPSRSQFMWSAVLIRAMVKLWPRSFQCSTLIEYYNIWWTLSVYILTNAQIDQYWSHLEALDCKWAKRVGDHKLIPCLVLRVIFYWSSHIIKIIYIYIYIVFFLICTYFLPICFPPLGLYIYIYIYIIYILR